MVRRALVGILQAGALALALSISLVWAPASFAAAAPNPPAPGAPQAPASGKPKPSQLAITPALFAGPGATVTMAPVGLSFEYPVMAQDLGGEPCAPPALAAELERLGSPPLQLGGDSQDMTAPGGALPTSPTSWETAILYSLPAGFWSQLHCLLGTTKDPLTVGLNLKTGDLAWATQMVAAAEAAATDGLSFSLGNEPDLYDLPNYSALAKPLADEESAAATLYLQLAGNLRPAIGSAALLGPELARPADWRSVFPQVLGTLHEQTVGVHAYPISGCMNPRAVTIPAVLSARSASAPARLGWVVSDARAAGLPAIISEANSASCGGLLGVSNSAAAAVWAARFVLSALKTGFGEVRFHFSGDPYDPFIVHGGAVTTRPIESALVALNQWLPVGSTVRTVPGVHELVVSAVKQPGGQLIVILDNETAHARPVVLRGAHAATLALLSPERAGLQTTALRTAATRAQLSVPANSLLAVFPPA